MRNDKYHNIFSYFKKNDYICLCKTPTINILAPQVEVLNKDYLSELKF